MLQGYIRTTPPNNKETWKNHLNYITSKLQVFPVIIFLPSQAKMANSSRFRFLLVVVTTFFITRATWTPSIRSGEVADFHLWLSSMPGNNSQHWHYKFCKISGKHWGSKNLPLYIFMVAPPRMFGFRLIRNSQIGPFQKKL